MPSRRISTGYQPFRVVSVKKDHGKVRTFQNDFKTEPEAQKHADKVAKIKEVISVYVQEIDADGYPTKITPVKRPNSEPPIESAKAGSDGDDF